MKNNHDARITTYFRPLAHHYPGALGLQDDAALIDPLLDQQLVVTTDAMVEGLHWVKGAAPADLAAKLLAINVADLLAMGATPHAYTLTTMLNATQDDAWLSQFSRSLSEEQRRYGMSLIGGDSVSIEGPLVLSITAFGTIAQGQAISRRMKALGQHIYVTGTIGDAALGKKIAQGRMKCPDNFAAPLLQRFNRPAARLNHLEGLKRYALAALDVSNGLIPDLEKLCLANGARAKIYLDRLPLSAPTRQLVQRYPNLWQDILTSSPDYEIAFVSGSEKCPFGTWIGTIGEMPGGVTVLDAAGKPMFFQAAQWSA